MRRSSRRTRRREGQRIEAPHEVTGREATRIGVDREVGTAREQLLSAMLACRRAIAAPMQ